MIFNKKGTEIVLMKVFDKYVTDIIIDYVKINIIRQKYERVMGELISETWFLKEMGDKLKINYTYNMYSKSHIVTYSYSHYEVTNYHNLYCILKKHYKSNYKKILLRHYFKQMKLNYFII